MFSASLKNKSAQAAARGANVYQCRNRESQKVYHGYLVPAKEIYGAATVPADTPLLEVSSLN
ncbi:hypothetical protein IE981_21610 [Klebsiella pneumoniae]|nr:hypothetical protein [Klebsiella pneumoniae]MBD3703006.1 hypothetical protein [Klebsiella pneumoniae]MCY0627637.1 hypothetical protein [Klebsiella pneumoniae]